MERPKMPASQRVYGEFIYWITILSAIICMIGPVIAMLDTDNNYMNPYYQFQAIFDGESAPEVWQEVGGGLPKRGGHFWLDYFGFGDGFTQFGLALGCAVAFPALIAAALAYLKERVYGYVLLCLWVAFMVAFSALGIVKGH